MIRDNRKKICLQHNFLPNRLKKVNSDPDVYSSNLVYVVLVIPKAVVACRWSSGVKESDEAFDARWEAYFTRLVMKF